MRAFLLSVLGVGCLLASTVAQAQTQTESTTNSLADNSPAVNVGGGSLSERRPGTWISAARARHQNLIDLRLNGPRFGQQNTTEAEARWGSSGSSSSSSMLGGLQGLLNLASQSGLLGSNGASSLSGLSGLISGLAGDSSTTGSTTNDNSSSTTGDDTDTSGLADYIRNLASQQAAGKTSDTSAKPSTAQARNNQPAGGAIGRLPKPEQRFQTSTQTPTTTENELSFKIRWQDAMLQTFFSALTVGLQSTDFINIIKDNLRPLFVPTEDTSATTDTTDTTGDGSNNGSDGTGGPTTGGGLDDIPSDGANGSGTSTI